jgi:hypothetical protein
VVELNESDDPIGVGTFGVDGIVVKAQNLSNLIEKPRLLTLGGGRHSISLRRQVFQIDNK